jgi:hypothetical protein
MDQFLFSDLFSDDLSSATNSLISTSPGPGSCTGNSTTSEDMAGGLEYTAALLTSFETSMPVIFARQ